MEDSRWTQRITVELRWHNWQVIGNSSKSVWFSGSISTAKHGLGPSVYDFDEDAAWFNTVYSMEEYARDVNNDLPALALIPGFHLLIIVVDLMHVLHRRILQWALGSE